MTVQEHFFSKRNCELKLEFRYLLHTNSKIRSLMQFVKANFNVFLIYISLETEFIGVF